MGESEEVVGGRKERSRRKKDIYISICVCIRNTPKENYIGGTIYLYRKTGRMVDSFFPLHAANRDIQIEQLGRRKQF